MTLAEYKRQAQELAEILMNFSWKEEEAEEFAKTLLEKYREFGEFNAKALECKNLAEFKNLADVNGMKFESDEKASELFLGLSKGKEEVEKAILSAEDMYAVSGGNPAASRDLSVLHKDDTERMRQVGPAPIAAIQPNQNVNAKGSMKKLAGALAACSLFGLLGGISEFRSGQRDVGAIQVSLSIFSGVFAAYLLKKYT